MYDGIIDPKTKNDDGTVREDARICIYNNKNESFANLDAENGFKNINKDVKLFNCELPHLKETIIPGIK
jgi:hypothetical protein